MEAFSSRTKPILGRTPLPLLLLAPRRWLAVTNVVGFFDILTVSNSGFVKVFLADRVHACSGIYHKLSFLGFCCGCGPPLVRRIECSFVLFFELCQYYWQDSMPCRGRIALVLQSLLEICPRTSWRRDFADEMDRSFLGCLLDAVQPS